MRLPILRVFLLFLRNLVSFFRKRWDRSTRRLWCILSFSCSRLSSRRPKKRDEIRRSVESRSANPPATVICVSRLPPPLTPIAGDAPIIAAPRPISIQARQPTTSSNEDSLSYATPDDHNTRHRGVDGCFLEEGRQVSRSPDSAGHHDKSESTHAVLPPNREDLTSDSPVVPSRPTAYPPSRYSYRSPPHLDSAEVAVRGYLHAPPSPRPSSPGLSVHPPSITGSVTSQTDRTPRLVTRVRTPFLELPEPPQSEPRMSVSILPDPHSTTVNFGPASNLKGRLRLMAAINRYENHKKIVVQNDIGRYICPPVTTQFVR